MKRSAPSIQSRRLFQRESDVGAAAGARLHGEAHVLVHGEVGEQVGELEGAADAELGAPRRAELGHLDAVEQHGAGAWPAAGPRSG